MKKAENISIGDESAEHFLMHYDASWRIAEGICYSNPLNYCADNSESLKAFNYRNPLYGEMPIKLLVPTKGLRRNTAIIDCRLASAVYPSGGFFRLRENLFMATPELVFLRMAARFSLARTVDLGTNLCGRYYLRLPESDITRRSRYLTTPQQIRSFVNAAQGIKGAKRAQAAVNLVTANSGSPEETHSWVQFCMPIRHGGFGLDFTCMNFDVRSGRLTKLTDQDAYSIDIANPDQKVGIEYDGGPYHEDASADKRRRNELKALGWDIFPFDASVLYNPENTVRFAEQVAKHMGRRLRFSATWEQRFIELRESIGLPV